MGTSPHIELSENVRLFRALVDALPQPILITNEKVDIIYVNKAWEQQFGYSMADVYGLNPRNLQSGMTPRDVYKRMWTALHAGKNFSTDEIIDKTKDGTILNFMAVMFPVQSNNITTFVQILTDITERKHMNEQRHDFLNASHWSVTPPLVKLHFLQELLEKSSDKKLKTHVGDLKAIENELLRLDRLTKKLAADFDD